MDIGVPLFLALTLIVLVLILTLTHRQSLGWHSALRALGLDNSGEGVLDGRGLSVVEARGQLTITVWVANRTRLLDEVQASDFLAVAPWIPALARTQLAALAPLGGDWRVVLEGRTLKLVGTRSSVRRPELFAYLVHLACDLAESVDARGQRKTLVVA
jgi:hypothetical protein